MSSPTLNALVHTMRYEADGIVSVEFRPASAEVDFPAFEAGSHIDLHLPNGLVRSYSLCNPSTDRQRYVVGVLNDRKSRGGSRYVHQQLRVGMTLAISQPRNNFKLEEGAGRSVLVAGGIGVTPIWCMLQRLADIGKPVELLYCARSRKESAFCESIAALAAEKGIPLAWHFDEEKGGPPDLAALLAGKGADSHYYCCGPTPMLDNFEKTCEQLGYPNAHIERFAAVHVEAPSATQSYVVQCAKSGKSVEVPPGKSILDSLIDAGLNPDHSCKEGVCGACETKVLEGEVDHHDGILTKLERASNKTMMICVSGCKRGPLVLDI
ncbi:PDR/VanB family oxidoreductase [Variovorax saccharolyticus]|uniref:PDR/VanB family oxidoreductase n=1 Tax=Variovorax saccharolyticus TaxID=3053516 RepID=UPI0025774893|nr:PDR/VanB family oxidoreductase [Variovorax sp. J31P216]MDM0023275.1 PDR/VanB family oxidoreductase [Variovorax sp. J31P216]